MRILKWKCYGFIFLLSVLATSLSGQTTVTISPGTNWTDACLLKGNNPNHAFYANTNYSTYSRIVANAWTSSGHPFFRRSLVKFNLSSIPAGSTIQSATLFLYSDPTIAGTSDVDGNSKLSGSNAVYFEKVTANWTETAVTWNNQPASTTTGRILFPASSSTTENIQVNLTSFVQSWVNVPTTNYGMKMLLQNELHYRSRNYASENHNNSAIRPRLVITYTTSDPDPIKDRMDHIFGGLNQSYINTGILTDYGMDLSDHTLYDGIIRSNNEMDINNWRALYGSLLSSVINPSSSLVHLKSINQNLKTYWAGYDKNNPMVDIPALFIRYQSLRSDAVTANLLTINNDRLFDVPNRPSSPYTTSYAFASAPTLGYDDDGDVDFIFRSSLFVNSSNKSFSSFQVDFGDGAGYQTMPFNTPKNINYNTAGQKTLKFRVQFTDNSIYYSHAKFYVVKVVAGAVQARFTGDDAQDYTFPRRQDTNCPEPFPVNPQTSYGATVTVEYGTLGGRPAPGCNPQFIRPLIVVEGFDASKFGSFGIDNNEFQNFVDNGRNGAINIDFLNGLNFSDALEAAGYDLIFVDYHNGTGDIVQNALLVEDIIRWVNAHKVVNPNTGVRESNVVVGQSMGGMVARYAVSDLEKRWAANPTVNPIHEVRLLVTQDAPHRGANVPLGFQALVNDLANYRFTKIGLATYGIIGGVIGSFIEMKDLVPAVDEAEQLLNEPAARQMLLVQDGHTNTFLNGAYRTMISFAPGYNPTFNMRALSNGSECGEGQIIFPGQELFFADANFYVNTFLYGVASIMAGSAVGVVSPALGAITTAGLLVLVPFTGKTWKTKLIVRSASGTNQVFYGNIRIEKKIAFLIPVNITVFSSSRNNIAGSLNWDSAPGGFYDLQTFAAEFPDDPNINLYPIVKINLTVRMAPLFNFVPTVSALDITTNPINSTAMYSSFTHGFNPSYPSRFTNFIAQEEFFENELGIQNNSEHILFTARNSQWLFNELQNIPANNLNCSADCIPEGVTLTGASTICGDDQSYTLNVLPAGYNVTWTRSPGLTYVSGQNSTTYKIRRTGTSLGPFWVEATLNGPCSMTLRKDILITIPENELVLYGDTNVCTNEYYWYDFINSSNADITGYHWSLPSGWSVVDENIISDDWIEVEVLTGSNVVSNATLMLTIHTTCGSRSYPYPVSMNSCGARTSSATVYPNPANDYLEISEDNLAQKSLDPKDLNVVTTASGYKSTESSILELKLYNDLLQEVRSSPFLSPSTKIITKDLPTGHYILHIIRNEGIEKRHIFIGSPN